MVETLFRSVGLVARYDKRKAIKIAQDLANYLKEKGLEVYVEETLSGKVTGGKIVPLSEMKTDFIITIGGDGTILRTCIATPKPEPPLLTINMGIRGFLTEVEPKDAINAVEKCLRGEFRIEKCEKLSVTANETQFPDALNEVVISAEEQAKILYAQILKNGQPVLKCQADGLMVSTQTGSTGYSLAAGGPVLDPEINAFVLTPICALTIFRSIVFPSNSTLKMEVVRPKKIRVLIDGHYNQLVTSKKPSLTITRSKNETRFIRFKENFYDRLRNRLLFKGMG
jgi:NAD+ kinase